MNRKELHIFNENELSDSRIRTIYAIAKYGSSSIHEIAEYYNLSHRLIIAIRDGNIFADITGELK